MFALRCWEGGINTFLMAHSRRLNEAGAFDECVLIYMSKHTAPMLIFSAVVRLSPAELRNAKLLTQWLQMLEGWSLIGLPGAPLRLIGWDHAIAERREMRGRTLELKIRECTQVIICWFYVCERKNNCHISRGVKKTHSEFVILGTANKREAIILSASLHLGFIFSPLFHCCISVASS